MDRAHNFVADSIPEFT